MGICLNGAKVSHEVEGLKKGTLFPKTAPFLPPPRPAPFPQGNKLQGSSADSEVGGGGVNARAVNA